MPSRELTPPGKADERHDDGNCAGADALTADALPARAVSFAGRAVDYGAFRPVPELIEEQAGWHPARTADHFAIVEKQTFRRLA